MISGDHQPKGFREIDETRAATRDEDFEQIIKKIQSSGGKITKDITSPLYTEIGVEEHELGTQRVVEFSLNNNLNNMDFQLIRKVETCLLQGSGRQKHTEPLDIPRIKLTLKKKLPYEDDWHTMDIDEIF